MPTGGASALQTQEVTLRPLSWPALQALSMLRPVSAGGDVGDSGGLLAPDGARGPTLLPGPPPRAALLPPGLASSRASQRALPVLLPGWRPPLSLPGASLLAL